MIGRLFRYFRWLSLDVTAGAIVLLNFLCRELNVTGNWRYSFLLGAAIWMIYTVDHVLDAWRAAETKRRKFHRKNARWLLTMVVALSAVSGFIAFSLPVEILIAGSVLGILALLYLLLSKYLKGLKEVWGAMIYASGVCMIPALGTSLDVVSLFCFALLVNLALLNLLIFARFEMLPDEMEGFNSFAIQFGQERTDRLIAVLFTVMFLFVCVAAFISVPSWVIGFFVIAGMLHMLIWWLPWFRHHRRYRVFGDMVFMLPLFFG